MGFFDLWKVSGITTDYSKMSEPFYWLAVLVDSNDYESVENESIDVANSYIAMNNKFDLFFDSGIKKEKDNAVIFLVFLASYLLGKDREAWNWQRVRHLSQGLYESMVKSPAHFLHYNTPIINQIKNDLAIFLSEVQ